MGFYASAFSYDGISSENFNLRIANMDESTSSNNGSGSIDILEHYIYKRSVPFFYGVYYSSRLSFPVSIFSPDEINAVDLSYLQQWLCAKPSYRELAIIQPDLDSVIFRCIFNNPKVIRVGNVIYGLEVDCECDSQFAWTREKTSTYTFSSPPSGSVITFFNNSHATGYLYPTLTLTSSNNSGSIKIVNITDGSRVTSINGLSGSEVITLDNDRQIIESSTGNRVLSNFNKNFLRLVNGVNNLTISGSVSSMSLTYQFARRLGG